MDVALVVTVVVVFVGVQLSPYLKSWFPGAFAPKKVG